MINGYAIEILRETSAAVLARPRSGPSDVWLPKSQIRRSGTSGGVGGVWDVYDIPGWLAADRGLLYDPTVDGE